MNNKNNNYIHYSFKKIKPNKWNKPSHKVVKNKILEKYKIIKKLIMIKHNFLMKFNRFNNKNANNNKKKSIIKHFLKNLKKIMTLLFENFFKLIH